MTEPKIIIDVFTGYDINGIGISMIKDDVYTLLIVRDDNKVVIYHKGKRKEITIEQLMQAVLKTI
jgi:hypothetical protein